MENTPPTGHSDAVERVLAGHHTYDALNEHDQAVVRAVWAQRITALRDSLDYRATFTATGEAFSEADEHGNVSDRPTGD